MLKSGIFILHFFFFLSVFFQTLSAILVGLKVIFNNGDFCDFPPF